MTGFRDRGSPFAPHTQDDVATMLDAIGVPDQTALFDLPDALRFTETYGIDGHNEQTVRATCARILNRNTNLIEFLGQGHYSHYIPAIVDRLSNQSEFLTSYTQYQPEVAQGFLQALFEYQSFVVELTGLDVANCSLYDAATALGEAARLARRVKDGTRILVPDLITPGRLSVLENYTSGTGLSIETYPMNDANVDVAHLEETLADDVVMVYVESPNTRGVIEEHLPDVTDLVHSYGAVCCLGSDPVALSLLAVPGDIGIDVVVGDASCLGLGPAYGMELGLFATRESFLRQVPGRIVGLSTDASGRRAYTLTLQTREQHIRRERATSNVCTNQAWLALRTAIHAAVLGPDGLVELAEQCVALPTSLAAELDALNGVQAPVHDRHHFREFGVQTDQPARAIGEDLRDQGFAVHVIGEHEIQCCVTDRNADATTGLVSAFEEAI